MQQPDMRKLMELARSPAGQQLIQALQAKKVPNIPSQGVPASGWDQREAKKALSSLMEDPQIRALVQQLEGQL